MGQNKPSPLLYRELSRLSPDIFSHPVWTHYIPTDQNSIADLILVLQYQVQQFIADNDPNSACQVLFLCAALEKFRGDYFAALAYIQQVDGLAKQHNLVEVAGWAAWGACALFNLSGQYRSAVNNLRWLRGNLTNVKDWVVVDLLEIIEQAITNPTEENGSLGDILELLMKWGDPDLIRRISPSPAALSGTIEKNFLKYDKKKFLSRSWWSSVWTTITKIASVDLHQKWVARGESAGEKRKIIPDAAILSTREKRPGWLAKILNYFKPRLVASFTEQAEVAAGYSLIPSENIPPVTEAPPDDRHENLSVIPVETVSVPDPFVAEKLDAPIPVEGAGPVEAGSPSLVVYCLGPFRVYQDEQPVENWPSSKGKAVFKYLVTHHDRPVIKDILMELFWPDTPAEAARNNLNVAIYSLRQALRKTHPAFSHVLFTEDRYLLNPDICIWLDYEAFQRTIAEARKLEESGDLEVALSEYSKAEALYQGEFLEEDRYEDWLMPQREQLQEEYLSLLARLNNYSYAKKDYQTCITLSRKMLAIDPCSEEAYRRLMRCYFERGQPHMSLRHYHMCVEALKAELDVAPSSATIDLYNYIRRNSPS